eukprot:5713458-Prymnesium_polylepis.1
MRSRSSCNTVPSNRSAEICCGLQLTVSGGSCAGAPPPSPPSMGVAPASIRMKVVLPMPFCPSITTISPAEIEPACTRSSNDPSRLTIA